MTNLTFAELTALIAANGLTVNDRYYITDKNWTIIAISKNSYRVVVPIVTEVTNAELDALVAANGLNEGLQYKVTDKDWLLIATSNNLLKPLYDVLVLSDDVIPSYIITNNVVFVKTIDFSVVTPFYLPIFDDYFVKRFEIHVLNDEELTGMIIDGANQPEVAGKKIINILGSVVSPNSAFSIASATDQSACPFKIAYHYQKMYSI